MSLLPRSHTQFQTKEYWDSFFQKRSSPFEWYGEYLDLCHVLHKYLKPQNKVLVIGCGNSKLSEDLYDVGFQGIENIDISETVIKQMTVKNKDKRPLMRFIVMDILSMSYGSDVFDCVLDKGTLDAIFVNEMDETLKKVNQMFAEVKRVLKTGGRYICITLAQEHILNHLLARHSEGWVVRVHKVEQGEEAVGIGSALPVFIFVMTKMMSIPGRPSVQVYEYVTESENCVRCDSVKGLSSFVKDCQQYALIRHNMTSLHVNEQIQLDLWSPDNSTEPRYTLRIVDQTRKKATNGLFAIFIVPQGREMDWLFSSNDGCIHLAESAGFERLVIITLHRGHTYQGLDEVKEEVSLKACELAQSGLPEGKKWPILTLGDGLGTRKVLLEDSSLLSGAFVVEESESDDVDGLVRRLVFMATPHLAQTEVLMKKAVKPSRKNKSKRQRPVPQYQFEPRLQIDHTHLVFPYHRALVASLALINNMKWEERDSVDILIIGLGGGALPMYINRSLPQISQDIIELDPKMVDVARTWFGFQSNDLTRNEDGATSTSGRVRVHVCDGVEYIMSNTSSDKGLRYHVVMLDVDSKDTSTGMSSPPLAFTTHKFLEATKSILNSDGIFVTNLVARNKDIENTTLCSVCKIFPAVLKLSISDCLHEILIGLPQWRTDILDKKDAVPHDSHVTHGGRSHKMATSTLLARYKFPRCKSLEDRLLSLSKVVSTDEQNFNELSGYFSNAEVLYFDDNN